MDVRVFDVAPRVSSSVFPPCDVSVCAGPFRAVPVSSVPDPLKIGSFLLFLFIFLLRKNDKKKLLVWSPAVDVVLLPLVGEARQIKGSALNIKENEQNPKTKKNSSSQKTFRSCRVE